MDKEAAPGGWEIQKPVLRHFDSGKHAKGAAGRFPREWQAVKICFESEELNAGYPAGGKESN
jgi:hypothetical protein